MTAREHDCGVILDEWECMTKKVTEHGVTAPAAKDPDFVRVNAAKKQGHGTAGTEGPRRNILRVDPGMAGDRERGGAKETGDHRTGNGTFAIVIIKIGVKRSCCRRAMGNEMLHATKSCSDWAGKRLAIGGVRHLLTFDTVLLCGEGEGDVGGRAQLPWGSSHDIMKMPGADLEFHVLETKRVLRVPCGVSIFARAKKKVESDPDAVHSSLVTRGMSSKLRSTE